MKNLQNIFVCFGLLSLLASCAKADDPSRQVGATSEDLIITDQPKAISITAGQDANFSVSVSGLSPIAFQWMKSGAPVAGANDSSLRLKSVSAADAGTYTVIVSNSAQSLVSEAAKLTVNPIQIAPTIDAQPIAFSSAVGTSASFRVSASGSGPLAYQWMKDGADIAGANDLVLSLSNLQLSAAGNYSVRVSNSAGSVTSSSATLTVTATLVNPSITDAPKTRIESLGSTVEFEVKADGTSPLTYQWKKNNAEISGATSPTLKLNAITAADVGQYSVVVKNVTNVSATSTATLTVITDQPDAQTIDTGKAVTFKVTAVAPSGSAALFYQWMKDGATISGATSSSLTISNISAANGGTYKVKVSRLSGEEFLSQGALLSVNLPPTITTQPVSISKILGTNATFSVDVTGTAPFTYQWMKAGVNIPIASNASAGTSSLTVPNVVSTSGGSYAVKVTNMVTTVTSNPATLSILVPPTITSQPLSLVKTLGAPSAVFSVVATGVPAPTYQWRKDGVDLVGKTAASLTVTPVDLDHAGTYTVVVTNDAGNTTSQNAVLTVNVPPSITTQPMALSKIKGSAANFSVVAAGTAPLTYQWMRAGVNISSTLNSSAISSTLTISDVDTSDAVNYSVKVTNVAGSVTSSPAALTVLVPPTITTQPISLVKTLGAVNAVFNVVATGVPAPTYQWRKDGVDLAGKTTASITVAPIDLDHAGIYTVVATNSAGNITSQNAVLTVNVPPTITTQPVAISKAVGSEASFSVVATGTAPLAYQWFKGTTAISGALSSTFRIPAVAVANAGDYKVRVSNAAGSLTSSLATLTIISPPTITTQPVALTKNAGLDATFSVVAAGGAPYSYQWLKDGVEIAGAVSASLLISNVQAANAGAYSVRVSNLAGSVLSAPKSLTVTAVKPSIVTQPVSITRPAESNIVFSVVAKGTEPFTYLWKKGTAAIAGATTSSFAINNIQSANGGTYSVTITNSVGNVVSSSVTLTVTAAPQPPTITVQPVALTKALNTDASFSVTATGADPLSYQWMQDGINLATGTTRILSLTKVQMQDMGRYSVRVTNSKGVATSNAVNLTVTKPASVPVITAQPISVSADRGGSISFSVAATSNNGALTYAWRKDGNAISGAVSPTLTLSNIQASAAGTYSVAVRNTSGSVVSSDAILMFNSLGCAYEGAKTYYRIPFDLPCFHEIIGNIHQVVSDPLRDGVTYVATDRGLGIVKQGVPVGFRTRSDGLSSDHVFSIAVAADGTIIAGTDKGISTSSNGGVTFSSVLYFAGDAALIGINSCPATVTPAAITARGDRVQLNEQPIMNLTVAPDGSVYAVSSKFIARSGNNGDTFCDTGADFDLRGDSPFNFIHFKGSQFFVGTNEGLIFADRNFDADSFFKLTTSDALPSNNVSDIDFDSSGKVYVATDAGVALSQNLAEDFQRSVYSLGSFPAVSRLEVSDAGDRVYALASSGLLVGANAGQSFAPVNSIPAVHGDFVDLRLDATNKIAIASKSIVGFSSDNAATFSVVYAILDIGAPQSLATDSAGRIYVLKSDGPYRSSDGGRTFAKLDFAGEGELSKISIINDILFVTSLNGLWISHDFGASFAESTDQSWINHVSVDRDGIIYAAAGEDAGLLISRTANDLDGFVRYRDSGLISNSLNSSYIAADGKIYVGHQRGMSVSADGGQNFSTLLDGLSSEQGDSGVLAIGMDSQGRIFERDPFGIRVSSDQGAHFSLISVPYGAFAIGSDDSIYVGSGSSVYSSRNAGATFSAQAVDGILSPVISDLSLDRNGKLYLVTSAGIFRSK